MINYTQKVHVMPAGCSVILDIGKTVAKLSLWSSSGSVLELRARPNARIHAGAYLALDAAQIENWLADTLSELSRKYPISTIVPAAHGAAAVILRGGKPACPPVDYESAIPATVRARYDSLRDAFSITGSPALPNGLNLGAQLAWLEEIMPDALAGDAQILPWPQYWAWLLSGVAACEVTSLGCHTDLWNPRANCPSPLAQTRSWSRRLAPLRRADEVLGGIRPEWAARTGLPSSVKVLCGLHDSNAALNAVRGFAGPDDGDFSLVSTGTWFVAMRTPPAKEAIGTLPEHRDCLLNVDWHGCPVPSARFMGGREIEVLADCGGRGIDAAADQARIAATLQQVVRGNAAFLPTLVAGVGPYPKARGRWLREPADPDSRLAAISLYVALVTDAMLDLIGARERVIVEGRFARAALFVRALATLRRDCEILVSPADDGVAFGALRLAHPQLRRSRPLEAVAPLELDLAAYKAGWREQAESAQAENET
jgi:sugar (pentulose or hexulose) kinase